MNPTTSVAEVAQCYSTSIFPKGEVMPIDSKSVTDPLLQQHSLHTLQIQHALQRHRLWLLLTSSAPSLRNRVETAKSLSPTLKRHYTAADLEAAVKDIRSGRIGTRRASVVYGIPRSTLRNKIYKLDGGQGSKKSGPETDLKYDQPSPSWSSSPALSADREPCSPSTQRPMTCPTLPTTFFVNSSHNYGSTAVPVVQFPLTNSVLSTWQNAYHLQAAQTSNFMIDSILQSNSTGSSKPSRPKRGQYRRYDKNALERAVSAVRAGEMSVHRAGSFFGVPHSTLEYKVKERTRKLQTNQSEDGKELPLVSQKEIILDQQRVEGQNTMSANVPVDPERMIQLNLKFQELVRHYAQITRSLPHNS